MTQTNAERYRERAEQRREMAEKAVRDIDRESWLRLAEQWTKLAQGDEAQRSRLD